MTTHILEMRGITKTFPGVKALANVNFAVERGEVHAICGENGAGKSTLMKVLSGVYPHGTYDGEIVFEGETVEFRGLTDSEAKGIVIIHQELALSPYLSIAENIFLNNEQRGTEAIRSEYERTFQGLNDVTFLVPQIDTVPQGERLTVTGPVVVAFRDPSGERGELRPELRGEVVHVSPGAERDEPAQVHEPRAEVGVRSEAKTGGTAGFFHAFG